MGAWTEVQQRADDTQRQQASEMGVGGFGGDEQDRETAVQTVMPTDES